MAAYEDQESFAATRLPGVFSPPRRGSSITATLSEEGDVSPCSSLSSDTPSRQEEEDVDAAARRQQRIAAGRMRAVKLQLQSDVIEQTEDTEVFVQSPKSAMRRRRSAKRDKALSMCSATVCDRHGIRRVASAPLGWPGSQPVCEASVESQEELTMGVMRRASEHTMVANLKQLVFKQQLRFRHVPSEEVSPTQRMRDRQLVQSAARGFTETWGKTLDIFQEHMTLRPPTKRHSIAITDLRAYSPATPVRGSPTKRHSLDLSMGLPAACGASPAGGRTRDVSGMQFLPDAATVAG